MVISSWQKGIVRTFCGCWRKRDGAPHDVPVTPLHGVDTRQFVALVITNRGIPAIMSDTIFDFAQTNLVCYGPESSYLAIRETNSLIFSSDAVVSNYTMLADSPLIFPGNLLVAPNGVLSHSGNRLQPEFRMEVTVQGNFILCMPKCRPMAERCCWSAAPYGHWRMPMHTVASRRPRILTRVIWAG